MSDLFYPYGAIYPPFGMPRRNLPVEADPVNPLPPNAMSLDTGDAGRDGYSVLSRASRFTGQRPIAGGVEPTYNGPRMSEEQ